VILIGCDDLGRQEVYCGVFILYLPNEPSDKYRPNSVTTHYFCHDHLEKKPPGTQQYFSSLHVLSTRLRKNTALAIVIVRSRLISGERYMLCALKMLYFDRKERIEIAIEKRYGGVVGCMRERSETG
jgi:hypothetical protein